MFDDLARYYDAIYYKPAAYEAESKEILSFIKEYSQTCSNRLLDIACGTGLHIKYFLDKFEVSGLDISRPMLEIAQQRYPNVPFHQANFIDFVLNCTYGTILCLYGSIGFTQTKQNLMLALRTFAKHLEKGGILVLTPWSNKSEFKERIVSDAATYQDIQIARMEKVCRVADDLVDITYHYLIGENQSIRYYTGHHPLIGLFSLEEYELAVTSAGLKILELHRSKEIQMGMAYICRKLK